MEFRNLYKSHPIEKWRILVAVTLGLSMMAGGAVEWWADKSHSFFWALIQFGAIGLLASQVTLFHSRRLSIPWLGGPTHIPVWMAGSAALYFLSWAGDFRHGFLLSHQYANLAAAVVGGGVGYLGQVFWFRTLSAPATVDSEHAEPPPRVRRAVHDLPVLVRNLALAMNGGHRLNERDRKFIENNLLAAVQGLIDLARHDKAALLLKRVPRSRVSLQVALRGLAPEDALNVAAAAYRRDDWGTSFIVLDYLFSSSSDQRVREHVLSTGTLIAEQVSQIDETFEAKIVALQLNSQFAMKLKAAARGSGYFLKRA